MEKGEEGARWELAGSVMSLPKTLVPSGAFSPSLKGSGSKQCHPGGSYLDATTWGWGLCKKQFSKIWRATLNTTLLGIMSAFVQGPLGNSEQPELRSIIIRCMYLTRGISLVFYNIFCGLEIFLNKKLKE